MSSRVLDEADRFYRQILNELQNADASVKNVSELFEPLLALLRGLGGTNDHLVRVNGEKMDEKEKLDAQLDEYRRRLSMILQQFPPDMHGSGKATGDPLNDAKTVDCGVSVMLQLLAMHTAEHGQLKTRLAELRKEVEAERRRQESIKKLLEDGEEMLKSILGQTKACSIAEMLVELRQMFAKERRSKLESMKQADLCSNVIKELKRELADLIKVLRRLFEKCADISNDASGLGIKIEQAVPKYDPDADVSEQFNVAIAWITDATNQLIEALKATRRRLDDLEDEKKKTEEDARKTEENLKRAMAAVDQWNGNSQEMEVRIAQEKLSNDGTVKSNEKVQIFFNQRRDQIKKVYEAEQARSAKMVELTKGTLDSLNDSLEQLKCESTSGADGNAGLSDQIQQLLAELESLRDQYDEEKQSEGERLDQLKKDEDELKARLKTARAALKNADEQRRNSAKSLQSIKAKLDGFTMSEHAMKLQLDEYNEKHLKATEEIARLTMENKRSLDSSKAKDKTMDNRDALIQQLHEKQAALEKEKKRLENENNKMRWKERPGERGCPNCAENAEAKREAETLIDEIDQLKKNAAKLRKRTMKDNEEIGRMSKERPGSRSSTDSRPEQGSTESDEAASPLKKVPRRGSRRTSQPPPQKPEQAASDGDVIVDVSKDPEEGMRPRRSSEPAVERSPRMDQEMRPRRGEPAVERGMDGGMRPRRSSEPAVEQAPRMDEPPSGSDGTGNETVDGGYRVTINADVQVTMDGNEDE